jgi:glycosyltransferase involved in cell wall biosynthesis
MSNNGHEEKNSNKFEIDRDKEVASFLENSSNTKMKQNKNEKFVYHNFNDVKFLLVAFSLILIFKIILIFVSLTNNEAPKKQFIHVNKTYNFDALLPRIDLNDKEHVPTLDEIFKSRILYINDRNISKEYIRYIKPIDEKEEEQYQKELYPYIIPNTDHLNNRVNQININEFLEICNDNKLLYSDDLTASDNPLISLIVPSFNKKDELMKSVRSIQNQSFKNIEIIIIDDCSTDDTAILYEDLLKTDPRVRVFYHLKNLGVFRTRIDGFLYSRGKYILHFDPGDLYADNLVLEDAYEIVTKYNLDSVRFSFKMIEVKANNEFIVYRKVYPQKFLRLEYGPVYHNVHVLGYGTIWDRIVRANIFTKGLCLFDEVILNAYKNMWEDMWWNQLTNFVSHSHLVINRIGYMYYSSASGEGNVKIRTEKLRNRTIREFIYFWLFDLELLPREDNKKDIINKLRRFNNPDNTFHGTQMHLDYLCEKFGVYEHLLKTLIDDKFVEKEDKNFVTGLLNDYIRKFH